MTSPQGNPARREPLLWLQLLGLAALPLETAALLLVLAGADPGPLPGLERLVCWGLGALAPAVLFWRLPPDLWSLLLLQVPLRGRSAAQLQLSAVQNALPLKVLTAAGAPLLLPLLWWSDARAGLAWAWSPFISSPRLVVLLVAAALLVVMLWQWHQLVQSVWMLSRPASEVQEAEPLSLSEAGERRLLIGLPLLLLSPLAFTAQTPAGARPEAAPEPETSSRLDPGPGVAPEASADTSHPDQDNGSAEEPDAGASGAAPEPSLASQSETDRETGGESPPPAAPQATADPGTDDEPESSALPSGSIEADRPAGDSVAPVGGAGSIEPEQAAEQSEGGDLDQQV